MDNIYPVIDIENGIGVHSPLPQFPPSNWRNKNRRPHSVEELDQLMEDTFGCGGFHPAQHVLCLHEFEPSEHQPKEGIFNALGPVGHWWDMGEVIGMGNACFDARSFPLGAPATFGDHVLIEGSHRKRIKFKRGKYMILVKDVHVHGQVEDPLRFSQSVQKKTSQDVSV